MSRLPWLFFSLFFASPLSAQHAKPLPVTPELLERYGIAREKYRAMNPSEKTEVQKTLTYGEVQRLGRIAQLQAAAGNDWPKYVDAKGWLTPEGLDLVKQKAPQASSGTLSVPILQDFQRKDGKALTEEDLARAHLILDRMFDGVAKHPNEEAVGQDMVFDARIRNETLYSLTATNPKTGWSYEVGQLGVDGRHAVLAPSWYGNITKRMESEPESWVDYRVHAQIGVVNLRSRFFSDGPDPAIGRALQLIQGLGAPQDKINTVSRHLTYEDPYRAHNIVVASLLTQLGRAYSLFGPVDVGWTVTNLTKMAFIAPNTAFDETLGVRVKLSDETYLGLFGGATQNISPIGNHVLQEALARETVKAGFNMETAPHATVALWGKMPAVSDLYFSMSGTQRWNRDTTVQQAEVSLMKAINGKPLTLKGAYSQEKGPNIEFDRRKLRAELAYQLTDAGSSTRAQAYIAYEKERIKYGNAEIDSDAFIAGLEATFGGSGNSITIDHVFGGEYLGKSAINPEFETITRRINQNVTAGLRVAQDANRLYTELRAGTADGQLNLRINELSYALNRLDPAASSLLLEEMARMNLSDAQKQYLSHLLLRTVSAGSAYYNELHGAIMSALSGRSIETEAFWLETRALAALESLAGAGGLTPAQRQQVRALLDTIRGGLQNGALPAGELTAYQNQAAALLASITGRPIGPAETLRLQNALASYARQFDALLAQFRAGEVAIPLGADAEKILRKIDKASNFLREHQEEITELVGLLTNPRVWDRVVVQAGRSAMMAALAKKGKVTIPIKSASFSFQLDASVALAGLNIMGSRLSPIAPIRQGETDRFLLRQAGHALGISGDHITEAMVVDGLFTQANIQFQNALRKSLADRLDGILARYDPIDAAQKIFAAVPPSAVEMLKQRYGVNLENLLPPPGATTEQIKALILDRIPNELTAFLRSQLGPEIAKTVAAMVGWAGEILRREINMTLLQLMLASEELNRLSVDQGLKAGDLGVRMMMGSFENLDKRSRQEAGERLHDVILTHAEETAAGEAKLADKFKASGKARLEMLMLDPGWPKDLEIEVKEDSWLPLLASYGDGHLFDLFQRIKNRYESMDFPEPMLVEFQVCDFPARGTTIRPTKTGVRFELPPLKDQNPAFLLSGLEGYLPEK